MNDKFELMKEPKISIPEDIQEICKDIAKVLVKHNDKVKRFSGTFSPDNFEWGEVRFTWEAGRHNEASNHLSITSQMTVNTKISQ